ncbi:MAG: ParB/RepB/Spo0J family partition protein [Proteobacteria bacterium]|nr:ParB/RepB/Spo0J family partition protein [Pseudomonadota bacterium]
MATKKAVESPEFLYLPLGSIIVEEQIRSAVDTTSESFKALMSSIKDKGVLEPVLVTQKDDKYLLLCGERRYLAAQKLDMETIPARIVNTVTQKDEILAIQLTENLQREDLNPIDQANGILAYIQAKHPDKGYNLDGVMSELVMYNRRQEDVSKEIAETISAISKIAGKSTRTMLNVISLLKLVPKIQYVIANGKLPVSQGYLFAANLGSPDFFTIFDEIMETPVTNVKLEKMLTAYKRRKPESTDPKPIPMKIKVASIEAAKTYFEEKAGMYTKNDLQTLAEELKTFLASIEKQIKTAPENVPVKQTDKKPVPQV